jgi:hypothetical protein
VQNSAGPDLLVAREKTQQSKKKPLGAHITTSTMKNLFYL